MPPIRPTILGALLLLGACAAPDQPASLTPGEWTGDVRAPEVPAAIGLLARVPTSGAALNLIALEAMGLDGGPTEQLRRRGDTLAFRWRSEQRNCLLTEDPAGAFIGECSRPGAASWTLRLLPPALRAEPVGHAATITRRTDYAWENAAAEWGRLHWLPAAVTADSATVRTSEIDAALRRARDILGADSYDRPLDAFLVDGRADIGALTGRPSGSTADPLGSTVVLAGHGSMPTVRRHEVMHVLSINLWGVPPEPAAWLREGIATFAGGSCAGYTLHELAASLAGSGRLLPLRTLIHDFYEHDDVVTYLQSGSVFQYLHDQYGRAEAREVWTRGLEPVLEARGDTLEEFEAEWRAFVADSAPDPDVDWSWRRRGCG